MPYYPLHSLARDFVGNAKQCCNYVNRPIARQRSTIVGDCKTDERETRAVEQSQLMMIDSVPGRGSEGSGTGV